MKPETAKQHNAPLTGEYEFQTNTNEAILNGDPAAKHIMKALFEACGWHVVIAKPKKKGKK